MGGGGFRSHLWKRSCSSLCMHTDLISDNLSDSLQEKSPPPPPRAWKNKRWHSFQSILLYVQAHICFPLSAPVFPIPINSWWDYCIIPWKLPNVSRCCRLELIARQNGLGCSWLLALMWSDKVSEARETTGDHSAFQSCSRSYQVNRRLDAKKLDPTLIVSVVIECKCQISLLDPILDYRSRSVR